MSHPFSTIPSFYLRPFTGSVRQQNHLRRQFVDCTVGGAGHSTTILKTHPLNQLICIDRRFDSHTSRYRTSLVPMVIVSHPTRGAFADVLERLLNLILVTVF